MTQIQKVKMLFQMMEKNTTREEILKKSSPFGRDINSERKIVYGLKHSRKKKFNSVDFFDLFGRMAS
jgi:hypothetical protein